MFLADTYPMLDVLWTVLILSSFVIWLWFVITVFADIIRRRDATGLVKAAWTVLILILPIVGVLIYLIVEGRGMAGRHAPHHERDAAQLEAQVRLRRGGSGITRAQVQGPHPPG